MFKKQKLNERRAALLKSFSENEKLEWEMKVAARIVNQLDIELEDKIVEDALQPGKMEFHYEVPRFSPIGEVAALKKLHSKKLIAVLFCVGLLLLTTRALALVWGSEDHFVVGLFACTVLAALYFFRWALRDWMATRK